MKVIGSRGEGSKRTIPPSKEDIRMVINAAGEDLRLMLRFAASTGARAGEQWAARWRDVNFDKGELRSMFLADKLNQITQLTFSNSKRNLSLAPDLFSFTPPPGVDVIGRDGK